MQNREFDEATFEAFSHYIDIYSCGEWYDGSPKPLIPKHIREMLSTDRTPEECKRFHAGTLSARKIGRAVRDFRKLYFMANRVSGHALLDIDIDAHEGQVDRADLVYEVALGLDGYAFQQASRIYLKVNYGAGRFQEYHLAAKAFIDALEAWRVGRGYESTVDSLKSVTTFGRLPTNGFNQLALDRFNDTPDVSLEQLAKWTAQLKAGTPQLPPTAKPVVRKHGSMSRGLPLTQDELDSIPELIRNAKDPSYQLPPL